MVIHDGTNLWFVLYIRRPLGGPSSSSSYGISQLFWIQASNCCSYSPWSRLGVGYSESLFSRDTGGWSPDCFYNAVHICLPSSYPAWKLGLSRVMAAQIGVPCWGNLTSPMPDMTIPSSCVIESSLSSRSYRSSSLSTTRVCTATEGPLPIPIQSTLSPQHINELPPTVNTGTFLSHIWQHNLRTRVWVQLVSISVLHFFLLISMLTMGSNLFTGDLGEKNGAEVSSPYSYPGHSQAMCPRFLHL